MSKAERFTDALVAMLPTGDAWPRHPGSVQVAVVRGIAGSLAELDDMTDDAPQQWWPQSTVTRLAEWESALDLPDGTVSEDVNVRRADVLTRLHGVALAYDDSSPAALGAIQDELSRAGFVVTLAYNVPARVGVDRCGARCGDLNGLLWVSVDGGASLPTFEVTRLTGYLDRVCPARFTPTLNLL